LSILCAIMLYLRICVHIRIGFATDRALLILNLNKINYYYYYY